MYVQLVRKLMGIIIGLKKSNNCIDYVYVTVNSIQLFYILLEYSWWVIW